MQTIHSNPCGRPSWTGIARSTHQGLKIHNKRPGALTGHDRGNSAGLISTQEQLARVVDLHKTLALHFEDAQFMGSAKAIFNGTQESMTGKTIPLKGEHGIYQMLENLWSCQHSLLGYMADKQQSRVLTLSQSLQRRCTFPHLSH